MGLFSTKKKYKVFIANYLGESQLADNKTCSIAPNDTQILVDFLHEMTRRDISKKSEFILPSQFYTGIIRKEFNVLKDIDPDLLKAIGRYLFGYEALYIPKGCTFYADEKMNTMFSMYPEELCNAKSKQKFDAR